MGRKRDFRPTPSLKRPYGISSPKIIIYVVCEGKNTEPKYFKLFALHHGNGRVKVEPIGEAGVPLSVVKAAVDLKKSLSKKANKKNADSFDKAFQVWAVSDRDEHPNIPGAKQLAEANDISFCVSNPCFELWGLLHICDQDAPIHRHEIQRKLKRLMPRYDHEKSAEFDYDQIKDHYESAKERAIRINSRREEEDIPDGNTSTTVYKLLDEIIEQGKK